MTRTTPPIIEIRDDLTEDILDEVLRESEINNPRNDKYPPKEATQ